MTVRRLACVHGAHEGRSTLEQRFAFEGTSAEALVGLLLAAPLVGDGSIFGSRPGREATRDGPGRSLRGFSPAPGFRFDVELTPRGGQLFVIRFGQPDRAAPYLQGEFTWELRDEPGGALWDEQINTERALRVAAEPLDGPRPSLRRWLFFRAGHRQVMQVATRNAAALLVAAD